ncbi:MAG: YqeG family HAD IIIA-type phosphatase [Clostridia bacterium]
MHYLMPDLQVNKVFDITPQHLELLGVSGVILDIDDTIIKRHEKSADAETVKWLETIKTAGFEVVIVSNNFKKRVNKISSELGLVCFSFGLKPFPIGIRKAVKYMKLPAKKICVIGDQIFTDVLGAKFVKSKVILVEPLSEATTFLLKQKRKIENYIKKHF